jgi:hypothetical protein
MFIAHPTAKDGKLAGKSGAWIAIGLASAALAAAAPIGFDRFTFSGGAQMGYTDGMNGFPWPALFSDPLTNNNRAGFYITQARLEARVAFDSSFTGIARWNAVLADLQEFYLEKRWGDYIFRAGKFRGAGLKSGTGSDEFSRDFFNAPRYARAWGGYTRLLNFRDFGIEAERDFRGGGIRNRLFIHNANGENVFNDEPSFPAGKATQVLGFDYALDWRISPYTVWGGHIGMEADRSWDEFVGSHEGWQAQYWFKSNPVADGSLNHQMDVGRFHMFNEALLMYLRNLPDPVDSAATKSWGVSTQIRFDHSERWSSLFRYEFFDGSDGFFPDDALHSATLGAVFRPDPAGFPGMKLTAEYVRTYEEALENLVSNDLFVCQFQMSF